jgi:MSHA biogenesis protein MshL
MTSISHNSRPRCAPGPRFPLSLVAVVISLGLLSGCAVRPGLQSADVLDAARAGLPFATVPDVLAAVSVVPPVIVPPVPMVREPLLDLLVSNAPARDVFLALVADTRYSMLLHPDVKGTLSVTLRSVTLPEALDAIRDVYGYDYKIEGRRITIYAPTLQTRMFTVNYPQSQRTGSTELRLSPGSALQASSANRSAAGSTPAPASGTGGSQAEGSRVSTTSKTDFWSELTGAVRGLIGEGVGRNVIASPQSGIMAVRAMPDELQQVDKFLKAAQIAVERQVMLEAKIVEVELSEGFQSGIDWSALRKRGNFNAAVGTLSGNTTSNALIAGVNAASPGFAAASASGLTDGVALPGTGTGLFGLALAGTGFQAVLGFLETQGDVQILSSPRIATLNNQKAILKVGSEDFFVTNVSGGTTATSSLLGATGGTTLPSLTLTPFFSGISLDVTPQIDDSVNITLHVHPSVTSVSQKTTQVDLGAIGSYRLPLASSSVNESDTLVRIQDGNIVAIGGLMHIESSRAASGLPGTSDVPVLGSLLGNRLRAGRKKEVVVLIKPTVIRTAQDWEVQSLRVREALDDLAPMRPRVIRLDGAGEEKKTKLPAQ